MKDDQSVIEETVAFMKSCYAGTNERPAMGFFLGNEYPNIRYPSYSGLPDNRPLEPDDFPVEPFLADCEKLYSEHARCPGDLFWTGTPFWGIPWIEAMLGCEIFYNRDSRSITAAPLPTTPGAGQIPDFSRDNKWVDKMVQFYSALARHSDGRYPIGTTRIRGLADILAAMLGGENFVMSAMTEPEYIHPLLEKISSFYMRLMEAQISAIPLFHGGMGSFYYYNWTPADTRWHQEDSVMLLSPQLYADLIGPYDRKIYSEGNNICHFHSVGGYIPYREILSLKPLAVEMHLDSGGPRARDLFPVHSEILKTTPLIIWGEFTDADFEWIFENLPPGGLILSVCASSPEEARRTWDRWM